VSFAAIDSRGRTYGFRDAMPHQSASVTKSMLLAGYLDRVGEADLDTAEQDRLRAMITYSDNDAADAVYATVGDAGLQQVADRVGMRDFDPAGYWSEAWITARDMARFMWALERRSLAPAHREFALELLAGIVPDQRWGIPAAAGEAWTVWFKGGWRPSSTGSLVHQAALLRDGNRRVAIAVLTEGQPSHTYGTETVRGVAQRLLGAGRPPAVSRAWTVGHARRGS
jgi:beta-lactamase class A